MSHEFPFSMSSMSRKIFNADLLYFLCCLIKINLLGLQKHKLENSELPRITHQSVKKKNALFFCNNQFVLFDPLHVHFWVHLMLLLETKKMQLNNLQEISLKRSKKATEKYKQKIGSRFAHRLHNNNGG